MSLQETADGITHQVIIRELGLQTYMPIWKAMQHFTQNRDENTPDEIWLLQHSPVFTQGRNGKHEHILCQSDIPVIPIDRGGQITYHAPGQIVAYTLIDIKRRKLGVRELVTKIEQSIIDTLEDYDLEAYARKEAPGVYIDQAKIAALGLRIKKGCSFHGLSFNIDMDLTPFTYINPCGYKDLAVTQLSNYIENIDITRVHQQLIKHLSRHIGYQHHQLEYNLGTTNLPINIHHA